MNRSLDSHDAGLLALLVAGALAWAITRPTKTSRPTPVRLGAQPAAPADLPHLEQLGPYRIGHAIGRGTMGVVYLAHDAEGRRLSMALGVALYLLQPTQ